MKHRWPQFNTIEFEIGKRIFTIFTPRRPMSRKTWMFSAYHHKNGTFPYTYTGVRVLGVEFQTRKPLRVTHES